MCNRLRGGGKCLLVLVLSATFLRREYKFREKGGDVATVAMHVAEVKRFADLLRRDAVSTQVQCGSPKRYGVTSTLVRRDGARSLRVSKQVQTIWMC